MLKVEDWVIIRNLKKKNPNLGTRTKKMCIQKKRKFF